MSTQITLLRHGDTGQRSYRGQLDDPLTELGWQQLRAATAQGEWEMVVSSTLQRCAAFATELAGARGLPLQLYARLREYHFGRWQGVPVAEIDATKAKRWAASGPTRCATRRRRQNRSRRSARGSPRRWMRWSTPTRRAACWWSPMAVLSVQCSVWWPATGSAA